MARGGLAWAIMRLGAALACFAAIQPSGAAPAATTRAPKDRPNFVVLFVDDLGYGDTGFTGHPTVHAPNIDRLAYGGKVLTTWYSGCPICSGSRAALMTGRQYQRTGMPGVIGPTFAGGLPLDERTIAEHLKEANYSTAIVGKWHLGQRALYLPGNRGFDYYLGIPYSDDMGTARASPCNATSPPSPKQCEKLVERQQDSWPSRSAYEEAGYLLPSDPKGNDPAGHHLPLVYQDHNKSQVLDQPVDLTTLAEKYNDFAVEFVKKHAASPFFLYMPFSHVHTTDSHQPEMQYAGCAFKNSTRRGPFGDALAEVDWIVGNVHKALQDAGVEENTLILFTGDNGPWLTRGLSGGSTGLLTGRYAGYWNTGKGSNWEGGIREAAFAYWKGQIDSFTRSAEVVSSMDVFPTLSALAGVPLPENRTFDGRDMQEVLLSVVGASKHDFLFFYGGCAKQGQPAAVRHGKYKAHWCTGPGLSGPGEVVEHNPPLLFNVEKDPSEAYPVQSGDAEAAAAMQRMLHAFSVEVATFKPGKIVPEPDGPGEGPDRYGVCCDRSKSCNCNGTATPATCTTARGGVLRIGSREHHDDFHQALGRDPPSPPTFAQVNI